jgi:small subunit ribosomal protein S17
MSARGRSRRLVGTVVSDRMQKTVVVRVSRRVQHAAYKKFVTARDKVKAHDERGEYKRGDRVEIVECRPLSRDKRWMVSRLIGRGRGDIEGAGGEGSEGKQP